MAIIGIVAVDNNWGIGYKNDLLFHIKEDMQFFKQKTTGHMVCMGHNTFKSLPGMKPLTNRHNVILCSSGTEYLDCTCIHTFEELISYIQAQTDDVYIIGGSSIYEQFLPYYDKIYVTKVFADKTADAFFPNLDTLGFTVTEKSDIIKTRDYSIQFITYRR